VKLPMPAIVRGDARQLPLPDEFVDLICTSPPYFGLRSYTDNGEHYDGQIGSEPTPQEFIAALIECTREMVRVLKPGGSIFINLGDKYATTLHSYNYRDKGTYTRKTPQPNGDWSHEGWDGIKRALPQACSPGLAGPKSLMLLPERYRIACVDELGLIARAVIVWAKPNGLPESVTDRVRRSHEDWVHLVKQPRYFAAVDEIREPATERTLREQHLDGQIGKAYRTRQNDGGGNAGSSSRGNPLGKLPGSVWEIATQPLKVPTHLGVDHFAAYPMEWPRRLIQGWCPAQVCTACGEGRRPVVEVGESSWQRRRADGDPVRYGLTGSAGLNRSLSDPGDRKAGGLGTPATRTMTGYACACPDTAAPSTPGVVLDPFGGTGTTALVATMLGRVGISVDLSLDYCDKVAHWRANDPKERARAAGLDPDAVTAIKPQLPGQGSLLDLFEEDGEPA
jgi:DNA modification methylase